MSRDLRRTTPAAVAARTDGVRGLSLLFAVIAALVALLASAGNAGAVTLTGGTGTDPWISSELPDYAPGSTVNLLGGSWQPGEAVHIYVNDSDGQTWVFNDDVTADADGDISDSFNLPNWFVANYSVTATGASGAIATSTFTDSQPQAVTVGSPTSVTVTQGNPASFGTVNAQVGGNASNCTMTLSTSTLAGDTGLPTGATASFGNSPVTTNSDFTSSLSVATTASAAPGTYTFHVRVTRGANCQGNGTIDSTQQLSLTINSACTAPAVTTQPTAQAVTYGQNASFTAAASGSPAPTVQWQVKIGAAAFTNISEATSTTLSLTKPQVSSSGNQYRAVFTNTCSGTQTATTAAATLTVNRKPITITPDSGQSKVYGDGDPALTYANAPALETGDGFSGTLGRAAGENVGSYAITLGSLSAGDNYSLSLSALPVNFAITKAPLTVTADDRSRAYGAANPSFTATYSGFKRGETLATSGVTGNPSLATAASASSAVGAYAITAGLGTLSSSNYSFVFANGTLTIGAATLSVNAEDKAKTYGDGDPAASYTLSGFANGEDATSAGVGGTAACSIGSHSENAGAYADVYSCGPGSLTAGNYDFVAGSKGKLTIDKKAASVTAADKSKVYGSDDPALTTTNSGFQADDLGAGKITFGANRAVGESVAGGPYTITPSASDGASNLLGNYDVTYNTGQLTITKKAASVTAEDKTKVYGSDDPALTTTNSGFLSADLGVGKITFSATRDAGETVAGGPYAISPSASDGASSLLGNYDVTYNNGQLTITKKSASLTADDKTKVYGDPDPALTTTSSGILAGDLGPGKITFGASRTSGETVAGGPYTITPSASDGGTNLLGNYDVTYKTGQLTITKKAASVTAEDKTKVYGSDDPALTTTDSGFLAADLGAGKITFGATRAAGETVAGGPYTITPSASDGASNLLGNYDVTYKTGQLTITKKAASVTAEDKSKVYGSDDPDLTTTNSGFLAADVGAGKITFGASRAPGETVAGGPYTITPSASDGASNLLGNYDVTYKTGQLTITKKAASVTAEDKTKVYGSDDPALTTTDSGFLAADLGAGKITFGTSRAPGETVAGGPYTITPSASDGASNLLGNYDVTYNPGKLTVTKKTASVTAEDKTKVYGSDDPALTTTQSGFLAADLGAGKITLSAARATGESVAGSPYAITPAASDGPSNLLGNYDVTFNTGQLTITKKAASVTADDKSKVYGDSDPALTTTSSGFLAADLGAGKIDFSASRAPGESVAGGPYAITPSASDGASSLLGNYDVTYNAGYLAISRRPLTVTADNKSKTYDGNPFSGGFTRTISGFAFGETDSVVSGNVVFGGPAATGVDAGNYVITADVSGLSAANYSFSAATVNSGNLTIDPRPITVAADPKSKVFGTSDPALTYQLTAGSLVGGDSLSGNLARDPGELVGTYAIKRGGVTAGANYAITYTGANLVITAWNAAGKGFYAPVGADAAHSIFTAAPGTAPTTKPASMLWNTIKGGQTVPLKFNVFAGAVEKTTSDAFPGSDLTKAFQMQKLANCTDSVATDPIDYAATSGQTVLRYDPTGMQWIQNWATPKVSATTCYRTFVTFADGSTIEAFFQLTK